VNTRLQQHAFHSRDNSVSNIEPNGTGRATAVEIVALVRHEVSVARVLAWPLHPSFSPSSRGESGSA
jgi:hypothetical protein